MTPKLGQTLVSKFKNPSVNTCDWRVIAVNEQYKVYTLQHFITGYTEDYTAEQLDIYFHVEG